MYKVVHFKHTDAYRQCNKDCIWSTLRPSLTVLVPEDRRQNRRLKKALRAENPWHIKLLMSVSGTVSSQSVCVCVCYTWSLLLCNSMTNYNSQPFSRCRQREQYCSNVVASGLNAQCCQWNNWGHNRTKCFLVRSSISKYFLKTNPIPGVTSKRFEKYCFLT